MTKISSKLVLITGGASGIGKLMGKKVLERGGKLMIWDFDKLKLKQTLKEFDAFGEVHGWVVDITNTRWIEEMARKMEDEIGSVDILINNAGIVYDGFFHEFSAEKIDKTMKVNSLLLCNWHYFFFPE